jgi:hypothetical protein
MRITLADRFKALLARDEYSYWFALITDDEKKLLRMDSWELARLIQVTPKSGVWRSICCRFALRRYRVEQPT